MATATVERPKSSAKPGATVADKSGLVELLEISYGSSGQPLRVDREAGIIRHVKIVGLTSQHGRAYSLGALRDAVPLYEGASVNKNHHVPKTQTDFRKADDGIGELRNVIIEPDGLYGDLHYLKAHPFAAQLCEAAERMPQRFGLSHHVDGKLELVNGVPTVTKIAKVRSVDLVGEGATTHGLFESALGGDTTMEAMSGQAGADGAPNSGAAVVPPEDSDSGNPELDALLKTLCDLLSGDGDTKDKAKKANTIIKSFLKHKDNVDEALAGGDSGADEEDEDEEDDDVTEGAPAKGKLDKDLVELREQVRSLTAREEARKLLTDGGIGQEESLVEAVAALPTKDKRDALIATLKKSAVPQGAKPRSGTGGGGNGGSTQLIEAAPPVPKTTDDPQKKVNWLRSAF